MELFLFIFQYFKIPFVFFSNFLFLSFQLSLKITFDFLLHLFNLGNFDVTTEMGLPGLVEHNLLTFLALELSLVKLVCQKTVHFFWLTKMTPERASFRFLYTLFAEHSLTGATLYRDLSYLKAYGAHKILDIFLVSHKFFESCSGYL